MLNVGALREGYVLDHIKAGKAMTIYHDLKLDKLDCTVAIIKNARSNKMGKKDIMKIECPIDFMDLDILGFIDHNITVNIIENKQIVAKKQLTLPKEIRNVIRCKNPRCITSIEQELDHVFVLTDEENQKWKQIDNELLELELKTLMKGEKDREIIPLSSTPDLSERTFSSVEKEFKELALELFQKLS